MAVFSLNETLASLFTKQAARTPDCPAVQADEEVLTYAVLNERANQMARYLQAQGIGPDQLVGICLERSIDLIVSIMGVLKAGGAYVPLDPAYPTERLSFMLNDSGANVLITHTELQSKITNYRGHVLFINTTRDTLEQLDPTNPASFASSNYLAYVMYTSGSTGKPKGVMIDHRGWLNYTQAAQKTYQLQPGERVLQFASISWDTSAEEIFPCLTSGATLVLRSADMLDSIPRFVERCAAWQITCVYLATAFWHELVAQLEDARLTLPPCLRVVIFGGERALWEYLVKWRQYVPPSIHLFNTYGQTECTAVTTCTELMPDLQTGTVPLGTAVDNVQVYLLKKDLQPVPEGEPGELYVGGPGVARGYFKQPELTAQKFIANPFGGPGERLYKTGDLVCRRPDGNFEFIGRVDQQVKIRGVRIEPGEIEETLIQHPAVSLAAVIGHPTGPSPDYLAAYVVVNSAQTVTAPELRNWLYQRVPAFLVPAVILFLDALPLTPNGKLDRRALPVPDFSQLTSTISDVEVLTETQSELQRIWQEVLGLKSIGLQDHFFEIGGHSLLATRVVARVRQRFNIDLSIREMFEAPTIAKLSKRLENVPVLMDEPVLIRRMTNEPLHPSFSQETLWFWEQLVPGNSTYNITDALQLIGPLDVPALETALNRIVERHEALRTHFNNLDGMLVPVIVPLLTVNLQRIEAPALPTQEQVEYIRHFAADEGERPFNLQTGPLLRVLLARLNPTQHILIIITHHIISDGWSITVFFQELSKLYTALVRGEQDSLPELPVQFVDYANWQRRFLQGERLDTHLGYWKENLKDISPIQFPLDRPRGTGRLLHGASLPIKFSADFTDHLYSFCQAEDVTLFMVLLAALQATLSRYTAQTDIVLGTAIANRHIPELDGLIGFFINTLVLRTNLDGNPSFRELLQRVRETTLGAYAHQIIPFELIVQAMHPHRAVNRNPLFDVMLLLQNVPPPQLNLSEIQAEFLELEHRTSIADFAFDLTETPSGLQGFCEYDTDLFDANTIQRLIVHFQTLLTDAIRQPNTPIATLCMLTDEERQRVLVEWNQTTRPYDLSNTIPDLFEVQARKTPNQIASYFADEGISYAILNQRANQVAHYLIAQGVQTESVVGVCLDRSFDLLVSLLGILKAGAVYLPLAPSYPSERLEFMLSDSQATWLITDSQKTQIFRQYNGQIIDINADALGLNDRPDVNPIRNLRGDNACYITYTSGSTGRPKGVIGLHQAAVNRFYWMWETYPFTAGEVCCQKTAVSFVDTVWETFGPLLRGVPLVILTDAVLKDSRQFVDTLAREHITRVVLVPSHLRLLLETIPNLDEALPDLHLWTSSGEALPPEVAAEFTCRMPGRILLNLYGSSEVAADSNFYEICQPGAPVLIGKPIANTQVYLLDQHLQPVPIGVVGEIYVGGSGLARGYWQRPDLTAERFITHPFCQVSGARLYKTGDLGRFWPDGNIEYLGRSDFQIKIRGFRVELGEVQNVLLKYPAVKQALIVARPTNEGPRLNAYIVAKSGDKVAPSDLRNFVAMQLPDYMVPAGWIFIDAFPLTPSGKIDQRALPTLSDAQVEATSSYIAPRDELELRLVKLWESLLETSPIGVNDNFFEIGGHSMLVVRLITHLEKELSKPLSLALIFHAPTVAQMANAMRNEGWKPNWASLVPIRMQGSVPPLFCVHADGGAFFYTRFVDYLSPQQPLYGLQARGLDGSEPPFTSVEEMAAEYLAEIRTIHPHGPYMISGFSMGGVVIFEMARQLLAAGEPPPLVIFIDAPNPDYIEEQDTSIRGKLLNLTELSFRERTQRILRRMNQRYRWLTDEFLSKLYLRFNRPMPPALRIHHVREMNHLISDQYISRPYAGPITILRASIQGRHAISDPTLGWGKYVTGKIADYVIPGDHETIFRDPNLVEMAKTLQTCIDHWLEEHHNSL